MSTEIIEDKLISFKDCPICKGEGGSCKRCLGTGEKELVICEIYD